MSAPTPPLGTLFAIGGAEAKLRRRIVLGAFVAAAGGPDARIAVISSASSLGAEVVEIYRDVFTSLGAREIITLPSGTEFRRLISAVWPSAAPRREPAFWPST